MGEDGGRNRLVPSLIVGEPQPTSGQIVEVEILRTAPVRKAHLERAAACDGFVLDQADAVARADGKLAISESGA